LPPDVRDWLPADQLAWFVIDAVAELDLSAFYAAYRVDGHGRAAYEPSLMVALVLYAFATRQRPPDKGSRGATPPGWTAREEFAQAQVHAARNTRGRRCRSRHYLRASSGPPARQPAGGCLPHRRLEARRWCFGREAAL